MTQVDITNADPPEWVSAWVSILADDFYEYAGSIGGNRNARRIEDWKNGKDLSADFPHKHIGPEPYSEENYRLINLWAGEFKRREAENARIEWMNKFYAKSENHDLPNEADNAKLSMLDMSGADRAAFELIKAWNVSDEFGFFLVGPAGCGKSFAMQALAKHIIFEDREFSEKRLRLRWFSVTSGLDRIRREMSDNCDSYKRSVLNAHYLFIDDLGAENLTEWAREQVYLILEHRIANGGVTFITSNCSFDEIKTRYHERFLSRIKEICVVLQLKSEDRRTDKMKANLQKLKARLKGI